MFKNGDWPAQPVSRVLQRQFATSRERRRGRKRTSRGEKPGGDRQHVIAHDEGMMDEGAASLRDRDMIAHRQGGPFVHQVLRVRLFSFCLSNACLVFFVIPVAYVARTPERGWTHSCHWTERSRRREKIHVRSRMPISRLFMHREICEVKFYGLRFMQYYSILS